MLYEVITPVKNSIFLPGIHFFPHYHKGHINERELGWSAFFYCSQPYRIIRIGGHWNESHTQHCSTTDIGSWTVITSYSIHYTKLYEVAAGAFVACIYAGSITVNIFLGAMNLLKIKQKLYLSKGITFLLLLLLALFPSYYTFFMISFLLGVGRAIRNTVYPLV